MLAIRPQSKHSSSSSSSKPITKYTPNLIPCRINHTASIKIAKRYWDPKLVKNANGNGQEELVTYFRGRRLVGRKVRVPIGWRGVVLRLGGDVLSRGLNVEGGRGGDGEMDGGGDGDGHGDDVEEREIETKILDEEGTFDALTVWGHECLLDASGDMVVRGMEEWMDWASAIHGCEDETIEEDEKLN